jgi:hypothetical protein
VPRCPHPERPSAQDPLNRETRVHSELGNVARSWPSVASHAGRSNELRARSAASMRHRSSAVSAVPPDVEAHMVADERH